MAKYLVIQEATYYDKYVVDAESADEAKEIVLSGNAQLDESEFSHAELDSNLIKANKLIDIGSVDGSTLTRNGNPR